MIRQERTTQGLQTRKTKWRKEQIFAMVVACIPLLGFIIFNGFPLLISFIGMFCNVDLYDLTNIQWNNFEGFKSVFIPRHAYDLFYFDLAKYFYKAVVITLWVASTQLVTLVVALFIATLLREKPNGAKLFQILFFIPYICSTVAVSLMWRWILDWEGGILNSILGTDIKWLEDPRVFRVNRLDAHSDHVTYASEAEAQAKNTSLRQSLDGKWIFKWSKNPASRPADFWQEGFDLTGFTTIQVPGHMETQGYDQIQYTNKLYPWDGHAELRPPQIDWDFNPVGSYVREFDLDDGLKGRDVCISFQGVEIAFYVWLNGHFVGYSEDSFTPADFDLTPYIREKGNRLCVEVYQRCSGSWLEDQDFFRFSGIFRPVFLYAAPKVEDLWIQSVLNGDLTSGSIRFRFVTDASVHAKISHPTDGVLFEGDLVLTEEGGYKFSQTIELPKVRLWDYGTPELYDVMLTVDSAEYIPYKTGFRRFEMGADKVMYLNGKRLMINGVNRVEDTRLDAGGKGINVSKSVKALGGETLAMGILGGESGEYGRKEGGD